jgi:hypothetical protein
MSGGEEALAASGHEASRADRDRSQALLPQISVVFCFLAAWGAMLMPAAGLAHNPGTAQNQRVVQGRVASANEQPLQNAIVYLEDQKSLEVQTFITGADGKFRFGQLSSDVDYDVWARYQNHKSKRKSISSFNDKMRFNFDLKVNEVEK